MSNTPQTLSREEAEKLLNRLECGKNGKKENPRNIRNYTIGLLMLDAGLRVGEVTGLHWGDVYFEDAPALAITVRAEISKTKTERTVPVSPRLYVALVRCLTALPPGGIIDPQAYFFTKRHSSRPLSTRQVERIIEGASKAGFGRSIHPHVLRHTFATRLMKVLDIRGVQQLLGHRNLSSTQVYTHPDNEDLKSAIAAISETPGGGAI